MGWACSRCTLYNSSASAVCGACEQPRPPAQQQAGGAQPPEVIDLLDDSSDEGEALERQQQQQQQQQQRQQQGKQQQTQEKQQQQDQRQRHGHIQQGHPLPQKQPAGPQQRGGRGAAGMIAAGSKNAGMDAGKDSPSSDDSFQIELSDVTSSKRRRTLGAAGSASVKKQQPVGSATAAGNGSGSSAETAVLAGAGGGGSKSAAPRLPPRQPQPLKGTAAVAELVRPSPAGRDEPAGSVTSGSPAPLPDSTSGGQRQRREGQHERAGKRDHDHRAQREADTPSPAGLAGLSLPPSKKQRLAAGSNGATAGVSAPRSGQLQAGAGVRGQGSSPAAPQAAPPSGLGALPLRHARLSKRSPQTLRGPRSTAAAQAQTGAGRPHGTSDLGQEPSLTVGGAALAAAGAAGPSPGRPPSRQLPPAARGLPVPLKPRMPGKPLEKHPQGQEVQQQQQQQQQQLPQPVQASLRLPPRPPTAQGSSLGSPAAGPSLALGVRHARQEGYGEQQELEQSPGSVGLLRQQSSSASPAGKAPVEQQAEPDVRQDLATRMDGGDGERHDEQQGPPAVGPHTFWQGLEAAYGVPCGPPAGVPAGVPAGKVGGAAVAGSAPAWVRRARHCAVDATPALLAAAADCPPVELEGQGQHPKAGLASATQGWLAFRLAARLPEAAACCNAEEVLELGAAMAAAAGPPPPLGAALEPRRQLGQGSAAGVGMCHVASRLLAAASRYQAHPMKLEERTNRWFHTRTPTFRKTLHKRLGDAFASTGGAGSAGGRHGGRRVGGGAAHGPSRLGKGAGAAAGQARGSIQRYPPAGRSAMTGVKNSGYGSFWATSTIRGKQIWLGTYRTQAAAGRAVDLVWLWKWVRGGCQGALPAFNVPDKAYQQDKALLERLRSINDPKALVDFIKSVCGAKK